MTRNVNMLLVDMDLRIDAVYAERVPPYRVKSLHPGMVEGVDTQEFESSGFQTLLIIGIWLMDPSWSGSIMELSGYDLHHMVKDYLIKNVRGWDRTIRIRNEPWANIAIARL